MSNRRPYFNLFKRNNLITHVNLKKNAGDVWASPDECPVKNNKEKRTKFLTSLQKLKKKPLKVKSNKNPILKK